MNSRIRELRKALHLSQKEFAERIGLKQNAVSCMEIDGATITKANIKLICMEFSVNEEWLLHGTEEMFALPDRKLNSFIQIFDELTPEFQDYLIKAAGNLLEIQKNLLIDI